MDPPAPPRLRLALAWWAALTGIILFVPSYPVGFLDGIPADHVLDFLAAIAAAMIMVPRHVGGTRRQRSALLLALLILCAALRISSKSAYGEHGLRARYEAEKQPGNFELQRSTFCDLPQMSRLDTCIDFDGTRIGLGRRPLWTDFLNSLHSRSENIRDPLAIPLKVKWTGYVRPSRDCTLALESNCAAEILSGQGPLRARRPYPMTITASLPNLEQPLVRLVTQDDQHPVPNDWLLPDAKSNGSRPIAVAMSTASWLAAVVFFYFFFRFSSPIRPAIRSLEVRGDCLVLLIALVSGALAWELNSARDPTFGILPPDDYLLYESEARSLVANGFCKDDGVAFHRSPAMRYYLAGAHALFGESGYGVILFQQVLRGITAILARRLLRRLAAPAWMGWAAAGLVVLLPGPLALSLRYWPETLGAFFFAAVCLTLVQAERMQGRPKRSAGAGLLCGLLALVRTNAVSLIPAVAVWTLVRRGGWRCAIAFLLPVLGVLSFVPLRNCLVTRTCVPTPTEGAVTLVLGSNIPRNTNIDWGFSGSPDHDNLLRLGMERLWEFDRNPSACYDPFAPRTTLAWPPRYCGCGSPT